MRAQPPADEVKQAVRNGGIDAIVFTSSSTVRNLVALCGKPADSTLVAVIGPQTAAAAREAGLRVDVESRTATVAAVTKALGDFVVERRSAAVEVAVRRVAKKAAPAKKPAAKAAPAKKAVAKKAVAKPAPAKKVAAKKVPAPKVAAKKAGAKKVAGKKTAVSARGRR